MSIHLRDQPIRFLKPSKRAVNVGFFPARHDSLASENRPGLNKLFFIHISRGIRSRNMSVWNFDTLHMQYTLLTDKHCTKSESTRGCLELRNKITFCRLVSRHYCGISRRPRSYYNNYEVMVEKKDNLHKQQTHSLQRATIEAGCKHFSCST